MITATRSIVTIGGGVFGISAAIEFRARGWVVTVCDPGPLPHPDASSTDISKAVRMDYGADVLYTEMAEASIEGWCRWNVEWEEPLYHADGFLMMTRTSMSPGSFEYDGFGLLRARGHPVERIDPAALASRFPAWRADDYVDGYFNTNGGWAESGRAIERLVREATRRGVLLREGSRFVSLLERNGRVRGIELVDGETVEADRVLMAAGAWTPALLPWLADRLWTVGQPVLYFRPHDPENFRGDRFPVWGADISNSGWYGFPLSREGVVKVGHHGSGTRMHPDAERRIPDGHEERCREFLCGTFPALADAQLVESRVCLYCDSFDGNFLIDGDPDHPGLIVASGGSGHGFKFAPILGGLIADVVEDVENSWAPRFAWRSLGLRTAEQARYLPDEP